MWISELSQRSGLPVATIKYYLRSDLLHSGEAAGATRAHYDESHVRRLRLIRALAEVGGLSIEAVRETLAAVDDEELTLHEGTAAARIARDRQETAEPATRERVDRLLRRWGWRVPADTAHHSALAQALEALDGLDFPLSDETLKMYADAMRSIAEQEVAGVPVDGRDRRDRATEYVVIGTLLVEPVLLSLRRLAHADLSGQRYGRGRRR